MLRGNIVYNENIGDEVAPVKVDLAELELAIVNIAANARHAMPNGGTFALSATALTAGQEAADNNHPGEAFFAVALSDTGTGIPPNLLSRMFDPFFTTKEVGKETGLGLSQVYGFAHQTGGLTATSDKGQRLRSICHLVQTSKSPTRSYLLPKRGQSIRNGRRFSLSTTARMWRM